MMEWIALAAIMGGFLWLLCGCGLVVELMKRCPERWDTWWQ